MKWMRIFMLMAAGFVLWSGNTYVSAKSAFDDVTWHSDYNEIRQYYNLAQNRDEDGLPQEEMYRQVYPDVKNGEFNIYWGQPLDEISADYELKWGVWSTHVGRYALQLNKIYKRSSPYLILWFNEEKLYKIWMYYPRGLNPDRPRRGRVVNDLTQKFGGPSVYNENILVWEDTTAKANSIEEQQLEKKFLTMLSAIENMVEQDKKEDDEMKKLCLAICFCLICNLCNLAVASAERDILADLKWGMTYDEIKAVYPLVYNNYLSEEDSNTYWLKLEEPYLKGKEVVNGRILLYMKGNKLYRITADFTDGTDLVIQSEAAGKLKYIGENLYWGASYAQVSRFYKLKYKEHDSTKNSPVYYMTLPSADFGGEKLKVNQVLAYFWNDQLYKIVAEKENGRQFVLQDDFLLRKAAAQGRLNEQRKLHDKKVAEMNEKIAAETLPDKPKKVSQIPNLYWGESINDIVSDYAVKYLEFCDDENALVYELDLPNSHLKENAFIRKIRRDDGKIRLYLWHNQLYKIVFAYGDGTEKIFIYEKLLERAALDGEAYKLGGGNLLKRTYREVYADAVNDKLYMYWGQPFKELSEIYELRWGIVWHTIYIFSVSLSDVYEKGSPYLVVMFSNEQLYKIMLCFDENIEDREQGHAYYEIMQEVLTEKFGKPDIYKNDILMWQSKTVSVDKEEETFLKIYLDESIRRTAHSLADEAEWAEQKK